MYWTYFDEIKIAATTLDVWELGVLELTGYSRSQEDKGNRIRKESFWAGHFVRTVNVVALRGVTNGLNPPIVERAVPSEFSLQIWNFHLATLASSPLSLFIFSYSNKFPFQMK